MNILITGSTGQTGWELARSLLSMGKVTAVDRTHADFRSPDRLRPLVREVNPAIIINAAAYTRVDDAEREEETAMRINAEAPGVLAEEARKMRALLVHYSTDYVFDGEKQTAYLESDPPCPLNAYGRSKLAGERLVRESGCDYLILRTAWVYSARGNNFVRTMLGLFEKQQQLKVVSDQHGAPTWARLISEVTARMLQQIMQDTARDSFTSGIFNLTASGVTSWYEFAGEIRQQVTAALPGAASVNIEPVQSEQYRQKAKRPKNSRLCVEKLGRDFGLLLPDWRYCLRLCLQDMLAAGDPK